MTNDERQIRQLVSTWMSASKSGDTDTVLSLMTDDVVFLRAGHDPMIGKAAFAAAMLGSPNQPRPQFDGHSEIQEVQISGDWAYLWSKLSVSVTFAGDSPPKRMAGTTLTVFRKLNGQWLLTRDANLLSPVT